VKNIYQSVTHKMAAKASWPRNYVTVTIMYCVLRRVCCGARLPFVEATILEILRYKTVVPLAMLHRALKDTEVGGFFIPEGTAVSLMLICGDAALAVDVKTFEKNV